MGTDANNNNVIEFTKATEMSFAALPRYAPGQLHLKLKKGKLKMEKDQLLTYLH